MKFPALVLMFSASALVARAETSLDATVTAIPADATALVFVVDTAAPADASAADNAPPEAPAAAAGAAKGPGGRGQGRRRFGNAAPKPPEPVRTELKLSAAQTTATAHLITTATDNVRVRVVALRGADPFPVVVASGKISGLKPTAEASTPVSIALVAPTLRLANVTPTTIAPGAKFALAGTVTDAGNFLGTKNRMRVWLSPHAAPAGDRAGTQVSTIDVTTKADDVHFAFELTAPAKPGPLFVQFGETAAEFARADGTQAPFLILPSLASDGRPLKLDVQN